MKLKFEPDLDFQQHAIAAVCDVFEGQTRSTSPFTVLAPSSEQVSFTDAHAGGATHGTGNTLDITTERVRENLRRVQLMHGLPPTEDVALDDLNLTVEMETGTGKTYVYLRTIFELHRRYGFSKFIIVVPSIAIKEGVNKSIQIMREHFAELYGNPAFEHFVYDSKQLGQVRGFATSTTIQVMVATIQSLHKTDLTLFHKQTEKLSGAKPIELIQQVRPIVIVDEPQSVEGGRHGAGRKALDAMQPLCTLRYSATHTAKYEMVYRLDAVDAYERQLVKGIEVASAQVEGAHDRPYVRVVQVKKTRTKLWAQLEVDCAGGPTGVTRKVVNAYAEDSLWDTTSRDVYRDVRVGEIISRGKQKMVQLFVPGDEAWLAEGESHGGVDPGELHRLMIRRTVRQHLKRELALVPRGIKVLSLFFVDKVENYRSYDKDGQPIQGAFAQIFEEEYEAARRHPSFRALFRGGEHPDVGALHEGYFSIDKKRRWVDTKESNASGRAAAQEAYALIMRDKERLLSLSTPLKFIFSHSALKEGWDNPNVFQICSLRDMNTERQRRQSIGRGLRLCVQQDGTRVYDPSINRLTVIATESVREFAAKLQEEIQKETGIEFGRVKQDAFAHIPVLDPDTPDGEPHALGAAASQLLVQWLKNQGYVSSAGQVQPKLKRALVSGELALPDAFTPQAVPILKLLRKLTRSIEVKDADKAQKVNVNRQVLDSPEFRALWDRIKHKTLYQVRFDAEALVQSCIDEMQTPAYNPGRARIVWTKATLDINMGGVRAGTEQLLGSPSALAAGSVPLPDILTELQDATGLTRRSIGRILTESGQLHLFRRAPQAFIKATADLINRKRREALIQDIRYERLGDSEFYAMELFDDRELMAYIGDNTVESTKSPHAHIVYDSAGVEKGFAEFLQGSDAVKLFAKLPSWFKIPTPVGTYNPDWALLVDTDDGERLYFVIETKGSLDPTDLRHKEAAKIHCGRRHFQALTDVVSDGPPVTYEVATKGAEFTKLWG
jgi:type III restriction enzyme